MKEPQVYSRKNEYETLVKPKLEEIKSLCVKHDIPYIVAFATENTEEKTIYEMDGLLPGVNGVSLKDNKLSEVYKMLTGYSQPGNMDLSEDLEDDFPDEI